MTDRPWSSPDGASEPQRPADPPADPGWTVPDAPTPPPQPAPPPQASPPPGYAQPPEYAQPPGYGPPPPGYGPPPAPAAPRKSRTGLWIGLGIGAFVLVCCLGVPAALGGMVYLGIQRDKADSVAALEEYLEALRAADHEYAYDMLCDADRLGLDAAAYVARAEDGPRLVGYDVGDIRAWAGDGEGGYAIDVELSWSDSKIEQESYAVYPDDEDFLAYEVCSLT